MLQQKIKFNYSNLEDFWESIELVHINQICKCICELYKIQSLSITQKYSIREQYIQIIMNMLTFKNEQFINKYLNNKQIKIHKLKNS